MDMWVTQQVWTNNDAKKFKCGDANARTVTDRSANQTRRIEELRWSRPLRRQTSAQCNKFLANVNDTFAICRRLSFWSSVYLSIVCNVRAPYSAGWNFPECLYAICDLGHPLTFR